MAQIADSRTYIQLLNSVKDRIRRAQYDALKAVNKELINLYGDIGRMIVERQEKEGWGKSVVEKLAADLHKEFPGIQGFFARNIWYMRIFHLTYRENKKLQPLVAEISWTKNVLTSNLQISHSRAGGNLGKRRKREHRYEEKSEIFTS